MKTRKRALFSLLLYYSLQRRHEWTKTDKLVIERKRRKMQDITDNVRQEIIRLVPLSLIEDVSCFTFYDHHPQDEKRIDITICTKHGEMKEFYRRGNVSSINLHSTSPPTDLVILRNAKCELFYLVKAGTELLIISTKGGVKIHEKIINVDRFTIDDSNCYGEMSLKVFRTDDAVPIVFDENFKSTEELIPPEMPANLQPLATELKRKLVEAKYSVANYKHLLKGYLKLRHMSAMKTYESLLSNHIDSIYRIGEVYGILYIRTRKPWVKVCNKKLVIALTVRNDYDEELEEVNILLNSPNFLTICYTTKQFETHPELKEKQIQKLLPNQETIVVAVLSLEELNVTSNIILNVAISFKLKKAYLKPVEDIVISSLEVLGDEFDSLSASKLDINTLISVQSTSVKTDLRLRDIKANETESFSHRVQNLLIKHMHMVQAGANMIIYKKSPYHALNGTLMHFVGGSDTTADVTLYTRTESQVLALIHCIINAVPTKIIITTSNYILTAKVPELSEFNESKPVTELDYTEYAKAILKRTGLIIEYLDWSMVKMSESKDPEIVRQIGFQIDLYACGSSGYKAFKEKMKAEGDKGVLCLVKKDEPKTIPTSNNQNTKGEEPMVLG